MRKTSSPSPQPKRAREKKKNMSIKKRSPRDDNELSVKKYLKQQNQNS